MTYTELSRGIKGDYASHITFNLNHEICSTCAEYNNETGKCNWLEVETHWDFICDGYHRKRSGQYRRMRAKQNKEVINE